MKLNSHKNNSWTPEQKNAIQSRGGNILVSAAAGSGKTAVLTQRIVEILLDEDNPCSVNELLVVTFTKAAANEMKKRIEEKINEFIKKDSQNKRLIHQKNLLKTADISTIHGFCNKLIKENFYSLNLSKDLNIASESEINILKQKVINEILDNKYKEKNNAGLLKLVNIFSINKDDTKFVKTINTIYSYVQSHAFIEKWFKNKTNLYDTNLNLKNTIFYEVTLRYANYALDYSILLYEDLINLLNEDDAAKKLFLDTLSLELSTLKNLKAYLNLKNSCVSEISKKLINFGFGTLKRFPKNYENEYLKLKLKNNRTMVKEIIKKINELFFISEDEYKKDSKEIKEIITELFNIVKEYMNKLNYLKKEKSILDFNDLEHYALNLLVKATKHGIQKTKIAQDLSEKYKYIMVDECQDINEIQNTIFTAISKNSNNLFMVGDVKQSIYGFRQAMPEIFLNKKENSVPYAPGAINKPCKIILSRNFRSKKGVLDFINFTFKNLMTKQLGGINYNFEEELNYGANYESSEDLEDPDVTLKILNLKNTENKDMDLSEAMYTVKVIKDLIAQEYKVKDKDNYRRVEYKDICILLRNFNKHAAVFKDVLSAASIPVALSGVINFLDTQEINVILDLLLSVSNPFNDINLFSTMLNNPYFEFTLDDIANIKKEDKTVPLYCCVKKSAKKGNTKAIKLINKLDEYRTLSSVLSIAEFLNYMYKDTSYIYALEMNPESSFKINNLKLFMHHAKEYENKQGGTFNEFVEYLCSLKEQNVNLLDSSFMTKGADNAVKIMSIHQSKGLEFPVCIVANLNRKLNKDTEDIVLHPKLGLGCKLLDSVKGIKYSNFQREAVKLAMLNSNVAEEIRVLYVALTRAKQKLIMLTSLKDAEKTLEKLTLEISAFKNEFVPPYFILKSTSFSDLICALALKSNQAKKLLNSYGVINYSDLSSVDKETLNNFSAEIVTVPEKLPISDNLSSFNIGKNYSKNKADALSTSLLTQLDRLKKFNLDTETKKIPSKISVTEVLNYKKLGSENTVKKSKTNLFYKAFNLEEDTSKSLQDLFKESNASLYGSELSLAKHGTFLHELIKIIDFKKAKNNFESYLVQLIEKKAILKEDLRYINLKLVKKFLNSSLMERILKSRKILKEYSFLVDVPISDIFKDIFQNDFCQDKKIILEGTIDCAFLENNNYVIVDYKLSYLKVGNQELKNYAEQLKLYKIALEKQSNARVKECILYSLNTGKTLKFCF